MGTFHTLVVEVKALRVLLSVEMKVHKGSAVHCAPLAFFNYIAEDTRAEEKRRTKTSKIIQKLQQID